MKYVKRERTNEEYVGKVNWVLELTRYDPTGLPQTLSSHDRVNLGTLTPSYSYDTSISGAGSLG